jgi:hypothetical protein
MKQVTTPRAPRASRKPATVKAEMYSYDAIEHGKLVHYQRPVVAVTTEMLSTLVIADSELDNAIIGALFIGKKLEYTNGSAFVKAINASKVKGAKTVSKNDVKASYDKLQAYSRIIEISAKPLQAVWDKFTDTKIAERDAIKKENVKLEANGEKPKTLPRITAPTVNGILSMLKPEVEVDHLTSAIKSMKTAYNHFLELKGKTAQNDSDKLKALIISNGGEV